MIDFLLRRFRRPKKRTVAAMHIPPVRLKSLQDSDVFLVSYPRSGNTWVRFLIYQLILAEKPDLPPPEHIDRILPDLHMHEAEDDSQKRFGLKRRILKSHNVQDLGGRKIIYIFREPADALVSYYHFHLCELPEGATLPESIEEFCRRMLPEWMEHVSLAVAEYERSPGDCQFVSYGQLHENTVETLRRMAEFCSLPSRDETLALSAERNSFEAMKKAAKPSRPDFRMEGFFRRGVRGSSRDELSEAFLAEIEQQAGAIYSRAEAIATSQARA
jgi:hypothetical protein